MAEGKESISRESILLAIVGLLLGIVLTLLFARSAVNNNMTGMMRMMGIVQNQEMMEEREEMMMGHDESMSMEGMIEALEGKTGDDFDSEFTSLMIEHHQGAIDMASLAKINAKHQEIKDLADDIISAQTKEINLMQDWQKTWGY
ncbi:MAG TPA: DUF305 domain-containing protein [Candidatus Nanoarchaeia archaeon]|nr:DUF305 domain-containing protein [Candidatus Nanoarchaeia archaeon]